MKTYHWKEYGFIGTVPDFARHLGVCKSQTFVNAVRRVSRHVYNCMSAREQAEYEEKRERVKPAFRRKYPLIPTLWMIFEDSTFAFRSGDKHRSRRIYGK